MKTPREIVEARWPGWIAEHLDDSTATNVPVLQLIAEGQREALEFAAQAAEIEDDGDEVARICRAKSAAILRATEGK